MAETREDAHKAFDFFVSSYNVKYPKAVKCLEKDRDELLAFYDFPAEHWRQVRTTNPIESMFKGRAPSASSHEGLREQERLTSALVVRQLPPWHEYLRKRQVKSPKVYIRDSGLLHSLLDIRDRRDLLGHPKSGASWEGFAMNQVFAQHVVQPQESYFWATHAGAELDLLVVRRRKRIGFEFKRSSAPELSKSMQIAVKDLRLKHLYVVFPGTEQYKLHAKVTALPLSSLAQARL